MVAALRLQESESSVKRTDANAARPGKVSGGSPKHRRSKLVAKSSRDYSQGRERGAR